MSKYDPEEYQRNKQSHLERQRRYKSKNRSSVNEKQQQYRSMTNESVKKYKRKRHTKIKTQYIEYMADKKCLHCGYSDYRALVWHHNDPSTKKNGVAQLVAKRHSWSTILEEIGKCTCLCHNCHMILHYQSSKPEQLGS